MILAFFCGLCCGVLGMSGAAALMLNARRQSPVPGVPLPDHYGDLRPSPPPPPPPHDESVPYVPAAVIDRLRANPPAPSR